MERIFLVYVIPAVFLIIMQAIGPGLIAFIDPIVGFQIAKNIVVGGTVVVAVGWMFYFAFNTPKK